MRKSQFCAALRDGSFRATGNERVSFSDSGVRKAVQVAELAGVAWDPEEPEVLWESAAAPYRYRVLATGELWFSPQSEGGGWAVVGRHQTPIEEEFIRRLLEEHKQQEVLDEHNDKMEALSDEELQGFIGSCAREASELFSALSLEREIGLLNSRIDGETVVLGNVLTRHATLERMTADCEAALTRADAAQAVQREAHNLLVGRVESLEARPALGAAGDLPGDRAQVAMHYAEWKKLVAVYELWGPDGTLRERLSSHSWQDLFDMSVPELGQLRSELLALPDEVKP